MYIYICLHEYRLLRYLLSHLWNILTVNFLPFGPQVSNVRLAKDGELPLGLSLHYALSENRIGWGFPGFPVVECGWMDGKVASVMTFPRGLPGGLCVKSVGEGVVKASC